MLYLCTIWMVFMGVTVCKFTNIIEDRRNPPEVSSSVITLHHGGRIQGRQLPTYKNNNFSSFQEIPYARPPVGNLRFKKPVEADSWRGVLQTKENTKICTQLGLNSSRETEDCLYLNVYTPVDLQNIETLLPVYFYIHGGVFIKNDGTFESFGPQFLMDYGIVLVTLNYRLGAFGFLSTSDKVLPGNLGLKDQNLALKWVQKNIDRFGGDPKKVTIGGQSAGAACVGHHILSGASRGLFRAAILESGSPLCSKMFAKDPKYFAYQLGHLLDKNFNNSSGSQNLLDILQKAKTEDIKAYSNLPIPEELRNCVGNEGNTVWNPVEEKQLFGFVKGQMDENMKYGRFNRVPILIGFNSEEEDSFDLDLLREKAKYFDSNSSYLINGNLNIKESNKFPAGTKLKKVYTNKTFDEDFPAFIKFISDAKYTTGTCRYAELASKYTNVYLYQFSYESLLGSNRQPVPGAPGVGHTEELNYLFKNKYNFDTDKFPEKDLRIQEDMLMVWTNFIKYLDPTPIPKMKAGSMLFLNMNFTWEYHRNPRYYRELENIYTQYADSSQYTY